MYSIANWNYVSFVNQLSHWSTIAVSRVFDKNQFLVVDISICYPNRKILPFLDYPSQSAQAAKISDWYLQRFPSYGKKKQLFLWWFHVHHATHFLYHSVVRWPLPLDSTLWVTTRGVIGFIALPAIKNLIYNFLIFCCTIYKFQQRFVPAFRNRS